MQADRPPTVDLFLLGVAVAAVSTSGPLVRHAAAPTLVVAFWRTAMASGVLLPTTAVRHRPEVVAMGRQQKRLAIVAGLLLAAHFATWVPSLSFTSVASSVALVSTLPIWSALIARLRGEVVSARVWAGVALAFLGAVLLAGVDLSLSARALFGDGLALLGGVLAAAYMAVSAEVRRSVTTTVYTAVCYSVAAIALLAVCLVGRQNLIDHPARAWLAFAAITIGPQLLGHSLVNRVLSTINPTTVSVAILFEIVGSTLLAWWWFGESPPAAAYPAAVLIIAGVVLVIRAGTRAALPPT